MYPFYFSQVELFIDQVVKTAIIGLDGAVIIYIYIYIYIYMCVCVKEGMWMYMESIESV